MSLAMYTAPKMTACRAMTNKTLIPASSQEADFKALEFKRELNLSDPTWEVSNNLIVDLVQKVKTEPDFSTSVVEASPRLVSPDFLTDLVLKVKDEEEDKKGIIRELVVRADLSVMKESDFKTEKDKKCKGNGFRDSSSTNRIKSIEFFQNETLKKHRINPGTVSKIYYNANHIKLVFVSVRLEDIFSLNDRKLGRAHVNDATCLCVYCRGEYKYVFDMQHLRKNLQTKKTSMLSKSSLNSKNRSACKQEKTKENSGETHSNQRPVHCSICSAQFKQKPSLYRHIKSVHDRIICHLCSASFSSSGCLYTHMKLKHSEERPFACNICSAKFKLKVNLKNHMESHLNLRPVHCSLCPAAFNHKATLASHMVCMHSNERPFKCSFCSASFKLKSHLRKHVTSHSSARPFKCESCPAAFRLLQLLKEHLVIHSGKRPYKCDICPADFKLRSHLNAHKIRHGAEKPFKCPQCPRTFKMRGLIRVHTKVAHTSERPFKCEQCGQASKTKQSLRFHMLTHSSERPFKCIECSAAFKTKTTLNTHMRSHFNKKLFECAHCQAKLRLKSLLIAHLSHCTGEVKVTKGV